MFCLIAREAQIHSPLVLRQIDRSFVLSLAGWEHFYIFFSSTFFCCFVFYFCLSANSKTSSKICLHVSVLQSETLHTKAEVVKHARFRSNTGIVISLLFSVCVYFRYFFFYFFGCGLLLCVRLFACRGVWGLESVTSRLGRNKNKKKTLSSSTHTKITQPRARAYTRHTADTKQFYIIARIAGWNEMTRSNPSSVSFLYFFAQIIGITL